VQVMTDPEQVLEQGIAKAYVRGRADALAEVLAVVMAEREKSKRARRGKTTNEEWVHHGEALDILRLLLTKLRRFK
jgi:hypothetical protein